MDANSILGYRDLYEEHCEEIMDELFTDVEHSLRLHRERYRPEPQPATEEPLVVSLVKVDVENAQIPIAAEVVPQWADPHPPIIIPPVAPSPPSGGTDKFLLGTAFASMLIGAAVVLGHYFLVQRSLVQELTPTPVATTNKALDRKTVEFSSEIKTAFQTASPATNSPSPAVPTPPPPEAPPPPQTVVQYVPVYSPPPVEPPAYHQPAPAPVYTEPVAKAKAPEPEPMPPGSSTTLSGIFMLEPNDRSYALIETNGAVQSVPVGGMIGSTGWRLKTVDNNTAILEKDGQSRSVTVGQKF